MADAKRTTSPGTAEPKTSKRREDLDALLKRIAAHVGEADEQSPAGGAKTASGPAEAKPSGADRAEAAGMKAGGSDADMQQPAAPIAAPAVTVAPAVTAVGATLAPADGSDGQPIDQMTAPDGAAGGPADDEALEMVRRDRSHWAAADQRATPALRMSAPVAEPPVLRSAMPGSDDLAATTGSRRMTRTAGLAKPVAEAPVASGDAPAPSIDALADWDRQAAEELSRFHEDAHDDATEAARPAAIRQPMTATSRAAASAMPALSVAADAMAVAALASMPLAERFADVAGSDAGLSPEHSDAGRRLIEAARRVESALEHIASKAAVDAIGGRVDALASRVSANTLQLARLDGIESRLGELGHKLSDEKIVELFGSLVPTAEDLATFAEDAAVRAADRVLEAHATHQNVAPAAASGPAPAAGAAQLGQLTQLIGAFIDDRRRHDAGTLDALETLQLAMQHLLDRIDQIDHTGAIPGSSAAAAVGARTAFAAARPDIGDHDDDLTHEHDDEHQHEHDSDAHSLLGAPWAAHLATDTAKNEPDFAGTTAKRWPEAADDFAAELAAAHAGEMTAEHPDFEPNHADHRIEPTLGHPLDGLAGPASLDRPHAASADESGQMRGEPPAKATPPLSDRQAFIAQARKAAERARAEADAAGGAGKAKAGKEKAGQGRAAQEAGGSAVAPRATRAGLSSAAQAKAAGMVRPGVLVITGLAAFLLAGYWLIGGSRSGLPKSASVAAPVAIEQKAAAKPDTPAAVPAAPQAPAAAPAAPGGQPDIDMGGGDPKPAPAGEKATGQGAPEHAPSSGARRSSEDETSRPEDRSSMQSAMVLPRAEETGLYGISVQRDPEPMTVETVASARERAKMATLSGETARHALARHGTSVATTGASDAPPVAQPVSATVTAPAAASADASQPAEMRSLVLPPAASGPLSLRLKAAKGDAAAQFEIASRLAEGRGLPQSFAQAAVWYQKAAMQGLAVAQYRLATLYERGAGVTADPGRAKIWYQRAADQGNLKAMHNLAVLATIRSSGPPDYETAGRLFKAAAERGLADSQYNLAVLAEGGLGVPKDLGAAYKWYTLAARSGDAEAARRRDLIIGRLSPAQIQATDKAIATWRPAPSNPIANTAQVLDESLRQALATGTRVPGQ